MLSFKESQTVWWVVRARVGEHCDYPSTDIEHGHVTRDAVAPFAPCQLTSCVPEYIPSFLSSLLGRAVLRIG